MLRLFDEKDRKILLELDKNARSTDSDIGKKIRASKQVVNYRIKKLIEDRVVTSFYTIVDVGSLGLETYYVFLQLEKINKESEKELLNKLNDLSYVGWLVSGTGRWDVILSVYSESTSDFETFLGQIIELCGNHLHEYTFTIMLYSEHLSYRVFEPKSHPGPIHQTEKKRKISLDKKDINILSEISQNPRASIINLAKKAELSLSSATYRFKSLIKRKVIVGFKPKIDVSKLGFQWHLLMIKFQNINKQKETSFVNFCKQHKKIYYVTKTIGSYNLMLDVHVKSTEEFKQILLELKDKYSDAIKLYESFIIFDEYKIDYFPSSFFK